MLENLLDEREERVSSEKPHLSYSQLNRYLLCPEQYRLYYIENLRPEFPSASLVFGKIIHQALAALFQAGDDPIEVFQEMWNLAREAKFNYSSKDSWEKLNLCGAALLEKFVREEVPRLSNVQVTEEAFEFEATTLDLPLVGIVDLIADLDGETTVIDFKTSATTFKAHEVKLSDQLSTYKLAHPSIARSALCVLVKTKEPKIEWHVTSRTSDQLIAFMAKTKLVSQEIASGHFYKRPGMWCAWCDYLPVCLGA